MAMKRAAINDDSSSDLTTSSIVNIDRPVPGKLRDLQQNIPTTDRLRSYKNHVKAPSISSNESHISFESAAILQARSSTLTSAQLENFRQRIEKEYDGLQITEAGYRYYISDQSLLKRARFELERAANGTYFVRPAELTEQNLNVKYFLNFVCHKRIADVPICCDENHRTFWFLSGCGPGSEVKGVYTGIDVLIRHKKENLFHELQYPFQIRLYQPIDRQFETCIPLPDEVRAMAGQNTMLHELATHGLVQYFDELIRMSKNDVHPLQNKATFIVNKINGRNKQGQTPLILAIQSKRYEFVQLLLDNKVDANITDTQGCSPLHYACRQADPKMLKKLIDRGADPHYVNQREATDGTCQSNLSAFHYLAMAQEVSTKSIKRCASNLVEKGCPLMPLTSDNKSPFDIAQIYNNNTYECVKTFFYTRQFNNLDPIEVSSRSEAKTILSDLASPSVLGNIRLRLKKYDNTDFSGTDGLCLLYKARRSRSHPNQESGLCVYNAGQVFVYPILQKHTCTIIDRADPSRNIVYKHSLITDTIRDNQAQVILFRNYDELIYNHTKYKGILPTVLKDYVQNENGKFVTMKASALLLPNDQENPLIDDEQTDPEDDSNPSSRLPNLIDHFDISQIISVQLLNENHRRIIWLAKVRLDLTTSFRIIIKDYLPNNDIDSYKKYRLNEFKSSLRHRNSTSNDEFPYEFSPRTHHEYNYESQLLLNKFQNHPLIVQTFICDHHLNRDLRIFMEYLPLGNLHSYLTHLEQTSLDPFIDAFHWIYQLAQVMAYLSKKNIVHRDLAARNILLQNKNHIKLSDFGLSRPEGVIPQGDDCILPPRWTAPECFTRNQKILSSSDVWSFGIVIWEIYSFGGRPYEIYTHNNSQELVSWLKRYLVEQYRRLPQPDHCSENMYGLMCRCWNINNDKRPGFVDIINDLNGANIRKDCIVPFTREERKSWKEAKEKYLSISQQVLTQSNGDTEYVEVEDNENDDKDIIMTQL